MTSKQVLSESGKPLHNQQGGQKQKLEHAKFLFLFTNDGAVIKLMLLPICVTAYTIQLYRPRRVSHICYLQLKL